MLIFNFTSCGIVSILFGIVGFVDEAHRWWAMILVTAVNCENSREICPITSFLGMMSTNCGGYYQCARYVAQQYSDVVISAIQFCKAIALFFVPALVALTVHDESNRRQWATAFCINSGLLLIVNKDELLEENDMFQATFTSFFLFSDKPADFTKTDSDEFENDSEGGFEYKL
uniref:Nucleos_tra2_C domain-containing protein n=1 Tax=Caenorhabditis tropicalis TaxID=1561998 RepID=A0A1I7TP75_9PELO